MVKQFIAALVLLFSMHLVMADDDDKDYPGVKGSDAEIYTRLTGTWTGKTKGFQGTLQYKADGECISDLVPVDLLMKMVAHPYSFSGQWEIKKGLLWSTVAKSSTEAIPVGKRYRNELLLLTDETFITKNEKGMITTFKKVKGHVEPAQ